VSQGLPTFFRIGNDGKLEVTDQIVVVPARILGLVVAFFVLRWLLHKAIRRFARRTGNGAVAGVLAKSNVLSRSKRGQEFVEQTLMSAGPSARRPSPRCCPARSRSSCPPSSW
jgi:small conductance mechanosensitive channel